MSWKFRIGEEKTSLLVEHQWYPARLLKVETDEMTWEGEVQKKFKFTFVILDPVEFENKIVSGLVNQPTGSDLNPRHKLFRFIAALTGQPPVIGQEIDFPNCVLGKIAKIQVKNSVRQYPGRPQPLTFQNVNEVTVIGVEETATFANRAPTHQPDGVTPSAPDNAPNANNPAGTQQAAQAQPEPQAQPQQPAAQPNPVTTDAAPSGDPIVLDSGEEIDLPF